MQYDAVHFVQADCTRLAGVSEFLTVSLLARKFGLPVPPHVGDMGQIHQHLVLFNHIAMGHEVLFLEHIPHLRDRFVFPAKLTGGYYQVPNEPGASCSTCCRRKRNDERTLLIGIGLTMIAGLMSGNCMLPMKFVRSWKWEHVWLVFSVVSLLLIPWVLAFGLVGNLFETLQGAVARSTRRPIFIWRGWGIAQVLFGISVARLGLALAYAIIVGLSALLGTLVPLFVQLHEGNAGHTLALVLTGVTVMVAGICLASWAGQLRESDKSGISAQPRQGYLGALMLAILCGLAAPMLNYSFAFGQDIAKEAILLGTPQVRAGYAVWPVGLAGDSSPTLPTAFICFLRTIAGQHSVPPQFPMVSGPRSWARSGRSFLSVRNGSALSWFVRDFHRLGPVANLHDPDRHSLRCVDRRMESIGSPSKADFGFGFGLPGRSHRAISAREPIVLRVN